MDAVEEFCFDFASSSAGNIVACVHIELAGWAVHSDTSSETAAVAAVVATSVAGLDGDGNFDFGAVEQAFAPYEAGYFDSFKFRNILIQIYNIFKAF